MKPLRCVLGLHAGQEDGGTMMFTCPRCGEDHWQRKDYSAVQAKADALIAEGRSEEAFDLVRRELRRG